ncbi:PREDICTED: regulating synaptic membrane exocytosis protein 3-like [Tinamus guttatus]|uniref:regulating synaptic membrane exocytosis protein 3-like n=1 Tax=Tinamus guttatus TaxID=94827 RepID=UPI00052E9436|nr:PREDICTED: regulating synaptic membrane exocytosis protein 3-like [Tinamus guttatus]
MRGQDVVCSIAGAGKRPVPSEASGSCAIVVLPVGYSDQQLLEAVSGAKPCQADAPIRGWSWPHFQATSKALPQGGLRICSRPALPPAPAVASPARPAPTRVPAATYVKLYLLENGVCLAKRKTKAVKKSCDPRYQQALLFEESPQGKVLQVIVWGDYGRMDHKSFMGMAQIVLEELDLAGAVAGWYKLFPPSSLADSSIGPLARRLSQSSLESSTSPSGP